MLFRSANRDLWEPLIDLVLERGNVTFRWVKGHSGDPMNDLVDRLAVAAAAGPFAEGLDESAHERASFGDSDEGADDSQGTLF